MKYYSKSDLVRIHRLAGQPKVSLQLFLQRINRCIKRDGGVVDQQADDALKMAPELYRKKYGVRKTQVVFEEQVRDLSDLYEHFADGVEYSTFRKRIARLADLGMLDEETASDAGSLETSRWIALYGGGRRRKFTYDGELYPEHRGSEFLGTSAFLDAIGRYHDRETIWSRLKSGWELDDALEVPVDDVSSRAGVIYLIKSRVCGRRYVGLTRLTLGQRWLHHTVNARKGASAPLAAAIREYGVENFDIEVLEDGVEPQLLPERERYWIDRLGTLQPVGLNVLSGGGLGSPMGREVEWNGIVYPSLAQAGQLIGRELGLAPHVVITRLAKGEELPSTQRHHSDHPEAGSDLWRRWKSLINAVQAGRRDGPVSERWHDYDSFAADVRGGFRPELSLVRLRDCEPWGGGNFKWVSRRECVEKSHGEKLSVDGKEFGSWQSVADTYGVSVSTLKHRVREQGMSLVDAVRCPSGPTSRKSCVVAGRRFASIHQAAQYAAEKYDLRYETARYRLRAGRPLVGK